MTFKNRIQTAWNFLANEEWKDSGINFTSAFYIEI